MNITKFFQKTDGYYYKIVTPSSWFVDCVDNNIDIFNIPKNTVFTAPETPKRYVFYPEGLVNEHGLHFAQGPMDTMLWHNTLCWQVPFSIYRVQPLGDVIKERCCDGDGLYQCCAARLKFLEKQDLGKMYDNAVKEYFKYPNRYPNIEVNVGLWQLHKIATNILLEPYCRY